MFVFLGFLVGYNILFEVVYGGLFGKNFLDLFELSFWRVWFKVL